MNAAGRPDRATAHTIWCRPMIELQARPHRAPNDPTSLRGMIASWERLLNIAPIAADDDFFDLGGDSLQALQLFHEIERATGRVLPITAIYEAATPARLLALLDASAPAPFSPLVQLKPGIGEPLFIAHGIGGNVIELKKLGQSIVSPRPVYAIQAKGVDGSAEPLNDVAGMVAFYLPHLRALQPHGPYYLAGYSFGGMVAMELARRLQADGETVALVGFIDSFAHPDTFPKTVRQVIRLRSMLDAFRTMPFGAACRFILAKLKRRGDGGLASRQHEAGFAGNGNDAVARAVHEQAFVALTNYRPAPYVGEIEFFRPTASIFPVAPKRIWGKSLGRINVHNVPGNHSNMMREHAGDLAKALSLALRKAGEVARYG